MQQTLAERLYHQIKEQIALIITDNAMNTQQIHDDVRHSLCKILAEEILARKQPWHTKEVIILATLGEVLNESQQIPELQFSREVFLGLNDENGKDIKE